MFPNNRKPHLPYDFSKGYEATFCCSYSHCTVPNALLPVMASKKTPPPRNRRNGPLCLKWKAKSSTFLLHPRYVKRNLILYLCYSFEDSARGTLATFYRIYLKPDNERQSLLPFLFQACYLLSALLQMESGDPVLQKAAETPPRWRPLPSKVAQHIWNISSTDLPTKPPLPLEGLENDTATP